MNTVEEKAKSRSPWKWLQEKFGGKIPTKKPEPQQVVALNTLMQSSKPIEPEAMIPLFFDANALRQPIYQMYRVNINGQRWYYRFDAAGNLRWYPHVTGITDQLKQSPWLIDWMVKQGGREPAKEVSEHAADYGTFMHMQIQKFILGGVDLDTIHDELNLYCEAGVIFPGEDWIDKIKNDLISFNQFYVEKEVEPLLVECVLCSDKYGYAGALDVLCRMTFNKKRVLALLDAKSGRKGFFENHVMQLEAYKKMLYENFPEFEGEDIMLFNWAPKEFNPPEPTYHLKNQSGTKAWDKFELLLKLYKIDKKDPDEMFYEYVGQLTPNKLPIENIVQHSLSAKMKEAR